MSVPWSVDRESFYCTLVGCQYAGCCSVYVPCRWEVVSHVVVYLGVADFFILFKGGKTNLSRGFGLLRRHQAGNVTTSDRAHSTHSS